MKPLSSHLSLLMALALMGLGLVACQSDHHTMTSARPGVTALCRECYDEVVIVRSNGLRPRGHNQVVHTHHCAQCKTDMSIYDQDGALMVRCAGCAPDGVACDKCVAPDSVKSP